jgi:heme-degrading monooxygenase HmoA
VIARVWRGWTAREDADDYERFLREDLLPQVRRLDGFGGAHILRREVEDGVEFLTMTHFDSLDAVRTFAGEDWEVPVIEPRARELLSRFEDRALHYESVFEPPR